MTPLTRCDLRRRCRPLLRPMALIRVLSLLSVIAALALGQVYLRFLSRDLQIETRKIQNERANLLNRQKYLGTETERLKRFDTVREYATARLGLRESLPGQTSRARVSSLEMADWENARTLLAEARQVRSRPRATLLASLSQKVVALANVSMVGDK